MDEDKFLIFMHRGGPVDNLENTMEAFRHSNNMGACGLELDVYLTKDDKLVVFHDYELKRLYGKDLKTIEANYSDFEGLKESIPIHFHKGGRFSTKGKEYPTPSVTLLKEVFEELPDQTYFIELK